MHYIIKQNGFIFNLTISDYLRGANGQPIQLSGTLADAISYVQDELDGTYQVE